MPDVPEKIFKSYDVRGVVGSEINDDVAETIGDATVKAMKAKKIAVGRDMREHSPSLEAALVKGITGAGADAVLIGQCSTPMTYYASAVLDVDVAIMITASHNPAEYNGFKFCKRNGDPVGRGTGLELIRDVAVSDRPAKPAGSHRGSVERNDLLDPWCDHLTRYVGRLRPMKIVIDFGNGVMGPIIRALLGKIDPDNVLSVTWLFDEPDGTFPWHPADPVRPVNLRHLQGAVLAAQADIGVAFDGDGDRLAMVDDKAAIVRSDLITALFARQFLSKPENHGKHVLYDLRSSAVVAQVIESAGGVAEMCRVGHSHVKTAMRGTRLGNVRDPSVDGDVIFAGELSGHFFFSDCFAVDSSERAFLLLLDILSADDRSLAELIEPLRKAWHSGEINFRLPDQQNMVEILDRTADKFSDAQTFRLDGISIENESWWANIRPSNTEPVLRLTAESLKCKEELDAVVTNFESLISEFGGERV